VPFLFEAEIHKGNPKTQTLRILLGNSGSRGIEAMKGKHYRVLCFRRIRLGYFMYRKIWSYPRQILTTRLRRQRNREERALMSQQRELRAGKAIQVADSAGESKIWLACTPLLPVLTGSFSQATAVGPQSEAWPINRRASHILPLFSLSRG